MRILITIEGARGLADDVARLRERLERSPKPLLKDIAESWAREVFPAIFDRGGDPAWEPLSPVSVKLRVARKPLAGDGILRDSFRVLGASDAEAEVGTELGAVHQLGGRTSPASMIPDKEIPARPFVQLDAEAIEATVDLIEEFYFGDVDV